MKRGIILINTGSPASTEVKDVKRYLVDFLTDPRIINIPKPFRHLLVRGIIAPRRAPKSAEKYQYVWSSKGSLLQVLTDELAEKLSEISGLPVYATMRYNRGSVERALEDASARGIEELTILPLFPHYAMSSFESAVAHIVDRYQSGRYGFSLKCVRPYYDHPAYIALLVQQIVKHTSPGMPLLFSYHGIPISQTSPYLGNMDKDYQAQCDRMTELILNSEEIKSLALSPYTSYQSRLGRQEWLTPATDEVITALAQEHPTLAVICPSFVCDNLETSWEINIQERHNFTEAGGRQFIFIPCPNASTECAKALLEIVNSDNATDAIHWTKP